MYNSGVAVHAATMKAIVFCGHDISTGLAYDSDNNIENNVSIVLTNNMNIYDIFVFSYQLIMNTFLN